MAMPTKISRVDLADREAVYYCLRCGATYARTIPRCVGCGAHYMELRSRLVERLHRSAPHEEISEFETMVLVPLSRELAEDSLPVIAGGLREEGYVHLFVDGEGRPVEELEWKPGLTLYVPEDEEEMIEGRIAHWLRPSEGWGQPSAEEDQLVALVSSSDPIETAAIRNLLDEAEISYTTNFDTSQLSGMLLGRSSPTVRFFVEPSDQERADALLDRFEGGGEGEPPPTGAFPLAGEEAGATETPLPEGDSSVEPPGRVFRVIRVARWALAIEGVTLVIMGPALIATGSPVLRFAPLIGLMLIGTAIYAGTQPRNAFGIGILLQVPITTAGWAIAELTGILLMPSVFFIALLIMAFRAAGPSETEPS